MSPLHCVINWEVFTLIVFVMSQVTEVDKLVQLRSWVNDDWWLRDMAEGLPFETIDRSIMQIDRLEALGVIDFSIASLPGQLFIKVPK